MDKNNQLSKYLIILKIGLLLKKKINKSKYIIFSCKCILLKIIKISIYISK